MSGHPRRAAGELPPDGQPPRWTPALKESVLMAIHAGEITRGEALRRWNISVEELDLWLAAHRRAGRNGLKVTAIQTQGRLPGPTHDQQN